MNTRGSLLAGALALLASACAPTLHGTVNKPLYAGVRRVVVLPFATPEGAPASLSQSFADELSSNLSGSRFTVIDRAATTRASPELVGYVEPESQRGADAVIVGRVVTYQDRAATPDTDTTLAIAIRVIDTRTGQVLLSTSADATAAATFCSQDMACLRSRVLAEVGRFVSTGED